MNKILLLLIIFFAGSLNAQSAKLFSAILDEYESFNYEEVIRLSNLALDDTSLFAKSELIEIYLMKSVAHFTANEEDSVRKSFIEILKIENDYKLDLRTFSPKIVNLFEKVKEEFTQITGGPENSGEEEQTLNNLPPPIITITDTIFVERRVGLPAWTYFKSALVPGWGQIDKGEELKGFIITGLSVFIAGSAIYYTFETASREDDYLSSTTPESISETYKSYNTAYQIRNGLILGYISVWLYSQFDLMLTGEIQNNANNPVSGITDIPSNFRMSVSIPF